MSDIVVAKRYAKALFEVAREKGIIAQVEQELKSVVDAIQGSAELQQVLKHPKVGAAAKGELIRSAFSSHVSEPVLNTLLLLIERRRENILTVLHADYVQIASEALGQADAKVYTPIAITPEQEQEIAAEFSKITGKTVRVETIIDRSLIGGIKVRIGDRLYDGSLSGKLDRLHKSLKSQAL